MKELYGFACIILGFLLSEFSKVLSENRREKKQNKRVRTLLQQEIATNIHLMVMLSAEVNRDESDQQGSPFVNRCRKFIFAPFPPFRSRAFESQILFIPSALSKEEIQRVYRFYGRLDALRALHETMTSVSREQQQVWDQASGGTGFVSSSPLPRTPFNNRAREFDSDLRHRLEEILRSGNPLP